MFNFRAASKLASAQPFITGLSVLVRKLRPISILLSGIFLLSYQNLSLFPNSCMDRHMRSSRMTLLGYANNSLITPSSCERCNSSGVQSPPPYSSNLAWLATTLWVSSRRLLIYTLEAELILVTLATKGQAEQGWWIIHGYFNDPLRRGYLYWPPRLDVLYPVSPIYNCICSAAHLLI